ncbi:MAG: hypothetical protein ACI9LY_003658 [Arenicella sp.]|jgi:hypothetical protein
MTMELLKLEEQATRLLLKENSSFPEMEIDEIVAALRVSSRENTGVGFFANFEQTEPLALHRLGSETVLGGVYAHVKGLKYGIGFLLFTENGYLDFLEAFSYGEPLPEVVVDYDIFIE